MRIDPFTTLTAITISSPQVAPIPPAACNALEAIPPVAMQCGGPISSSGHALMQRSHSQDFGGGGLKPTRLAAAAGAKLAPNSARGGGLITGSRNQLAPGTGMVMSRSVNDSLGPSSLTQRQFQNQVNSLRPPSPSVTVTSPAESSSASSTLVRNARIPKNQKAHSIPHRWHQKRSHIAFSGICSVCQRPLGFLSPYEKCKMCKQKIHSECKSRVGDSCGLTPDHLSTLIKEIFISENQGNWGASHSHSMNDVQTFQYPDQETTVLLDSSSSTNSSTPSTPAIITTSYPYLSSLPTTNEESPSTSPYERGTVSAAPRSTGTFTFDEPHIVPHIILPPNSGDDDLNASGQQLVESQGSDCTVASSETTVVENHLDAANAHTEKRKIERNRWNNDTIRGPSLWSDLNIPYNKIDFDQKSLIGKGHFGEVHRGEHFGEVAVKMLYMDHVEESRRLEVFKQELSSFRNSRHDYIVLFLGWTTIGKDFGIVMNYCRGKTLHQILHGTVRPGPSSAMGGGSSYNLYNPPHNEYDRLDFSQMVNFAQQICQGVSYLHTKKILHKDLRSKNIFVEKNKIVITDFGIFSMKRLVHRSIKNQTECKGFVVPKHWLCYLAPELIRRITANGDELPFSMNADVFAFGTIWYELLTQRFPYDSQDGEAVMYLAGTGIKGALQNLNATRESKLILMKCWNSEPSDRVNFLKLAEMIDRFPRKRMNRSPSFPYRGLSRSHESLAA
ncbi:hypothetical protein QR680_011661 [Steinernema hermaphroditum]|uniref:Protein kinase domain-containing protein n=1 Tax=Steinernema hermaphroditum TaxID=289476 RepID=A0AA39LZD6_9BILA|nr:hypothetical protein QR680_011661 [Steinernema hermaphroditum]